MSGPLRIALAQLNLLVGDVAGNTQHIVDAIAKARDHLKAQAVAFPELSLTSYPPEDLLFRPGLYRRIDTAMQRLKDAARGIDVIVGYPERAESTLYNAACVLREGKIVANYRKQHLPNYGVFDERRYFLPGDTSCVVDIADVSVGITVCEDLWQPGPIGQSVAGGASVVLNINASPYHRRKHDERVRLVAQRAREHGVPILYLNLVGGQDELVFDGESFVTDSSGTIVQRAAAFEEQLMLVEVEPGKPAVPKAAELKPLPSDEQSVYQALALGVRDYVTKNGFPGAVIGLSGGIDSALTLCIAVDALGAEKVQGVLMPSRYTSAMSIEDAQALAKGLGVATSTVNIEPMFTTFVDELATKRNANEGNVTEENLQARVRGMILMAISNTAGRIVLTTGNKSEMAVGYATLYGDMAGGFAVIKDVPKTLVYKLAQWRNAKHAVIPQRIFDRPPSAELAPDQKDSDSLPPYDMLDPILERFVERDESPEEIVAAGFDEATVRRVISMVDRNEYKRRQAPPGVRITPRAFGRDRRYPITSGYNRVP